MKYQLGIALSGGGVRGAAHIGVLQALSEYEVRPDFITGTSAGALVGALYAAGYDSKAMLDFFRQTPIIKLSNYAFGKPGLMDSSSYTKLLDDYLSEQTFESLDVKLSVATTDLQKGNCRLFDSGPLVPALVASAAVPPLFSPVVIDGQIYADGGIVNNLPIEPLRGQCRFCLGVFVNPLPHLEVEEIDETWEVLQRAFLISTRYDSLKKLEQCDWGLSPEELMHYGMFDQEHVTDIFDVGYRAGQTIAADVRAKLDSR